MCACRHRGLFASGRRVGVETAAAAAVGGAGGIAAAARRRPAEPVQLLTFDDVACSVPLRQRRRWRLLGGSRPAAAAGADVAGATADVAMDAPAYKQILKGVSGVAACGELVGVLGPSGGCWGRPECVSRLPATSASL